MLDMGKKYGFMTSHWMEVVEAENYEEGEVLMFWFRRASEGGLKCYVDRISPGAFGIPEEEHLKLLEAHGLWSMMVKKQAEGKQEDPIC